MTMTVVERRTALLDKLVANGRTVQIPEGQDLYGWLVGSWDLEVEFYGKDVSNYGWTGEAHFAWVLDGYAIQDTWTLPRWREGSTKPDKTTGTTLRIWNPDIGAWSVLWINPVSGARDELVGRRVGQDLVQIGRHRDGAVIRWSFREITNDSFRWIGEVLEADGITWRPEAVFRATRRC